MPHQIPASGGTPPYTFAITGGALPPGLTMSIAGLISGIPTAAGIYPFTVTVTDSLGATNSVNCSITIYPNQYFYGNAEQLVCDVRYPWLIPPDQRTPWRQETSIPAPAIGVTTEIWNYLIPDNYYLVVDRLRHFYEPSSFIQGAGAIIWTLDIDAPIGFPLQNWRPVAAFTNALGAPGSQPFPVGPLQIRGGAVLRYKAVITDPTVPTGPPNTITAFAGGWLYPVTRTGN